MMMYSFSRPQYSFFGLAAVSGLAFFLHIVLACKKQVVIYGQNSILCQITSKPTSLILTKHVPNVD